MARTKCKDCQKVYAECTCLKDHASPPPDGKKRKSLKDDPGYLARATAHNHFVPTCPCVGCTLYRGEKPRTVPRKPVENPQRYRPYLYLDDATDNLLRQVAEFKKATLAACLRSAVIEWVTVERAKALAQLDAFKRVTQQDANEIEDLMGEEAERLTEERDGLRVELDYAKAVGKGA